MGSFICSYFHGTGKLQKAFHNNSSTREILPAFCSWWLALISGQGMASKGWALLALHVFSMWFILLNKIWLTDKLIMTQIEGRKDKTSTIKPLKNMSYLCFLTHRLLLSRRRSVVPRGPSSRGSALRRKRSARPDVRCAIFKLWKCDCYMNIWSKDKVSWCRYINITF